VESPAVAEMQTAFLDNWIKATGTVLHGEGYFPQLPEVGHQQPHLFFSSPAGGSASMHPIDVLSADTHQKEACNRAASTETGPRSRL
jgi:cardiolipin synthase